MKIVLIFAAIIASCSVSFAKPAGKIRNVALTESVSLKLLWIPPGNFIMGSPPNELGRSENESQVPIKITKGFYLAETEVTQAQWKIVIPENPSAFRGDHLPVENITWADAKKFCETLNALQLKTGQLPQGYHWDLPTEAQWEYACRAGTSAALHHGIELTSADQKCPHLNQVAWYQENARGNTQPVGGKKANRWGLKDMHGNVWEWCRDNYTETNPGGCDPWFTQSSTYVRRGGSAGYQARTCRAASRDGLGATAKGNGLGLRLALVPIDSSSAKN